MCDQPSKSELVLAYESPPVLPPLPRFIKGLGWAEFGFPVLGLCSLILAPSQGGGHPATFTIWIIMSALFSACGLGVCLWTWRLLARQRYRKGGEYKFVTVL